MSEPNTQLAMLPEPRDMTPMQMLQVAVSKGVDTEQIKALMDLQREWKADRAREAFVKAMSEFRSESIKIIKDKPVSFGNTNYKHATLAKIVEAVTPKLGEHGLSCRWDTNQEAGGLISVSCILMHELGHSERVTLSAAPDNSGGKNSIQAVGSTVSYLQRYTLMAITGLAAQDQDTDGRTGNGNTISEAQVADLTALIEEVGADKDAFLQLCRIDSLEQLPASKYAGAVKRLEARRGK